MRTPDLKILIWLSGESMSFDKGFWCLCVNWGVNKLRWELPMAQSKLKACKFKGKTKAKSRWVSWGVNELWSELLIAQSLLVNQGVKEPWEDLLITRRLIREPMSSDKGSQWHKVGWSIGESMTSDKSWLWNTVVDQLESQWPLMRAPNGTKLTNLGRESF